jgi:thiamine-monophosphate kinase
MNEFDLIRRYFQSPARGADVCLGVGDDAAVLSLSTSEKLVVTVDTLVEAVHFEKNAPPEQVAARCVRTNLSDLAAMGATPKWFTLALTLPDSNEDWLQAFSSGLNREADRWQIDLVGGDTTKGALTISLQMMGVVKDKWLTRTGAKVGDAILVTGTLGDAAGYLAVEGIEKQNNPANDYLEQRFWYPEPRLEFAQNALGHVNAACDISDGLLADLGHICRASGVGADIQVEKLPLSDAQSIFPQAKSRNLALSGGDDYELCMTATPGSVQELTKIAERLSVRLERIGTIVEGSVISCFDESRPIKPTKGGYLHFS